MLFVPTMLAFMGFVLCAAVAFLVVRAGVFALSGEAWAERWAGNSFITYAWHEFGRSIFLGLVAAAGTAPMGVAFFAGSQRAVWNVLYLTGVAWACFAAGIFLVGVSTGVIGYLRYEHASLQRRSLVAFAQILVVAGAVLPVFIVFVHYLLPTLADVVMLWLRTMGLYARLAAKA